MALVKFYSGLSSAFNAGSAEANSLYFLTDTKQLYKGSVLYADMSQQEELAAKLADIANGAQVNVLESVTVNGSKLTIADKNVTITIAPGSAKGTISVNGTDVAVTGLGTAAYENKEAFDEAGAAKEVQGETTKTVKDVADEAAAAQADVDAVEEDLGNVDSLETTNKTVVGAINEVLAAVGTGGTAAVVTITTDTTTDGALKSYTVKQGDTTVGVIDIPKDMVVESGSVVTDPAGQPAGTYIKLVLANVAEPLYINVGTLVDIYVVKENATQVQLAIDPSTREISASIVTGSIGTAELADAAVTTVKIADANVTKAKLSTEVQASLDKADAAASQTALNEEIQRAKDAEAKALADAKAYADQLVSGIDLSQIALNKTAIEALDARMATAEGKITTLEGKAHTHDNKAVLDGITSAKVTAWDAAESNAKSHANDLNSAMDTRMQAVEGAVTWGTF